MFIRNNLPHDVADVYFSGTYYYAASVDKVSDKPKGVGCGKTQEEAITDMRKLVMSYTKYADRTKPWTASSRHSTPSEFGGNDE